MTTTVEPAYTRKRVDRGGTPTPLAFVFESDPVQPEHEVTTVAWTTSALQILRDLGKQFAALEPRQSLPVEVLRGRLEVGDTDNLRLDHQLGLWSASSTLLWTPREPGAASQVVGAAVVGWLTDDVPTKDARVGELVHHLRRLAREGKVVVAARRKARVFAWEQTRSGTALSAATNRDGYADLADFIARRLEGEEILPGLGGMRRVASGRLDSNQAELLSEPVLDQATPFSIVVRVRVVSFPGRATPVVVLELSRRLWSRVLSKAAVRGLSAYALPEGACSALRFTLHRRRVPAEPRAVYAYVPGEDFAPIARAYGLPLDLTGDQIASSGHSLPGCRLLVGHKHGVGERVSAKQGVPDLDKLEAFRRVEALLAPHGFRPWQALSEIPSTTRPVRGRGQEWRDRDADEDHREAFERWLAEAKADIAACYTGMHHVVVAYHPSCYHDAQRVRALLNEVLDGQVRMQLVPIPQDVHGGRQALPQPTAKTPGNRDYADLRARAWRPFVAQVERYQDEAGTPINGILVVAPKWYDGSKVHDDPVNKRAARLTLARELRVPVQYLRPEQEDGQFFRGQQDPARLFETRVLMAWLDLAWKTIGRIKSDELATVAKQIYSPPDAEGATPVLPPDHVLAVGILRRNGTRLANEKSFVPYAIELDVVRGTCSARFARDHGSSFEATPLRPLAATLVELASSGPIRLAENKAGRSDQLKERSEYFFHEVITDFCQRAQRPLVLIDAVSCRQVWDWVADTKLDPNNVVVSGHLHAEADWGDVRVVRVRTQNAPKVLFDRYFIGESAETGDVVCYDAPKWAEAQLFKLGDSRANVYLSFGSLLRSNRILGSSCYRAIDGLKRTDSKPGLYARRTIDIFTGAWSTPTAVEFTVVRTMPGETPEQVAQLVEWLRTLYEHVGDWTTKPAPLFFETALKEYLADYDLDDEDSADEDDDEGDLANQ
jgi:hypothetical protein